MIPLFIRDTDIFDSFPKDDKRRWFQREALSILEEDIQKLWWRLYVATWKASNLIQKYTEKYNIEAVFVNKSYWYWSMTRDAYIKKRCRINFIKYHEYTDYLILNPEDVPVRKVFTPFFKKRLPIVQQKKLDLLHIDIIHTPTLTLPSLQENYTDSTYTKHDTRSINGIRDNLHDTILQDYTTSRNLPADTTGTTKLSPYLAFGIVSPREVLRHFLPYASTTQGYPQEKNRADTIISELAWREFWQSIAIHFDQTVQENYLEFQDKRKNIVRENSEARYEHWKNGTTWYPIVDAGMRQLKAENWMHNRVRMIVASFLCKDLLIDRRRGEKHFANYLIDYDRNVNIGNRQRSASVWADPKPLRIFNPILQSQKYDPKAEYILRRIPELAWQDIKAIHDPIKYSLKYHAPIVDHYVRSKIAKQRYNEAKERNTIDNY